MKMQQYCLVMVLAALLAVSQGARILAVYTIPDWSHWNVFRPFLWELAERGHNLTIITAQKEKQPHENWSMVPVGPHYDLMPSKGTGIFTFGADKIGMVRKLLKYGVRSCERLLKEREVQQLLTTEDEKFDLLITELFFNDCFLVLAYKFKIPIVGTCPFEGTPWMDGMVGNPRPLAYVADQFLDLEQLDSLLDRAINALYGTAVTLYRQLSYLPALDAIVRQHVPDAPSIADLERATSLVMLNWHISFNVPRPMLPNIVGFGGMHIQPPKALPKNLQKFLDDAAEGAIYFSLGTNAKSTDLSNSTKQAFNKAFSCLKQKVLWKFDEDNLPGKPDNVMIAKWLPQPDILAHKNIRLFMTHGGLMSIQEAIYHGIPIIGFPVFGDQFNNVNRAQSIGLGIKIAFPNISVETLTWAIKEVLEIPSYRETAKQRARIFHDSPRTSKEEAVYWVEYVLRHKGAPHLRSAVSDLTWYQYLLLDVLAAVLLAISILLVALVFLIKFLQRFLGSYRVTKKPKKFSKTD